MEIKKQINRPIKKNAHLIGKQVSHFSGGHSIEILKKGKIGVGFNITNALILVGLSFLIGLHIVATNRPNLSLQTKWTDKSSFIFFVMIFRILFFHFSFFYFVLNWIGAKKKDLNTKCT